MMPSLCNCKWSLQPYGSSLSGLLLLLVNDRGGITHWSSWEGRGLEILASSFVVGWENVSKVLLVTMSMKAEIEAQRQAEKDIGS